MDTRQVAALLGRTELFGRLDQRPLLGLAERTTQRTFSKGAVVFVQEELGDRMFVVAEGAVRLVIHSYHGEVIELARRTPPDAFGELAVLDGGPRSATAEAVQRTRLVVVTRRDLIDLLRSEQPVVEALLSSLGALVRRANRQTADLAFLTVADRIAGRLLELAGWQGGQTEPERLQPVRVTQTDLAQMVNGARQTVNKVLGAFESRGLIRVAGQTIELLQPRELHRLARG
jgi:CRP/FNR family transcriptional regulator, cyclic AMP receptor protein